MKKILVVMCLAVLLGSIAMPAFAAVPPIVFCGQRDVSSGAIPHPCTLCDLLKLVKNISDFLIYQLTPVVATVLILISGIMIMLNVGGGKEGYSVGIRILKDTIIAVIIVYCAWLITNTFIQIVAGNSSSALSWFKLDCEPPKFYEVTPSVSALKCSDPVKLAQENNEPTSPTNDPQVTALIGCIQGKLPGVDLGEISTFDKSHPLCNFTRGSTICGSCSHSQNSCHYGGNDGSTGARAVDFGNETVGDKIIQAARACGQPRARCENSSGITVACSLGNHVHVSTNNCNQLD